MHALMYTGQKLGHHIHTKSTFTWLMTDLSCTKGSTCNLHVAALTEESVRCEIVQTSSIAFLARYKQAAINKKQGGAKTNSFFGDMGQIKRHGFNTI